MTLVPTRILKEIWEIEPRLLAMGGLSRPKLLQVRNVALGEAANATPFFCSNSAGTFAYHYGVAELRHQFVGDAWRVDRPRNIEVISNTTTNIMVGFCNVDVACNDDHDPVPRSEKGVGAEFVAQGNLFGSSLIKYANRQDGIWSLYYLMVDENGAAELSCPVVEDGKFKTSIERIYLSDGSDFRRTLILSDNGDVAANFDPQVTRKRG